MENMGGSRILGEGNHSPITLHLSAGPPPTLAAPITTSAPSSDGSSSSSASGVRFAHSTTASFVYDAAEPAKAATVNSPPMSADLSTSPFLTPRLQCMMAGISDPFSSPALQPWKYPVVSPPLTHINPDERRLRANIDESGTPIKVSIMQPCSQHASTPDVSLDLHSKPKGMTAMKDGTDALKSSQDSGIHIDVRREHTTGDFPSTLTGIITAGGSSSSSFSSKTAAMIEEDPTICGDSTAFSMDGLTQDLAYFLLDSDPSAKASDVKSLATHSTSPPTDTPPTRSGLATNNRHTPVGVTQSISSASSAITDTHDTTNRLHSRNAMTTNVYEMESPSLAPEHDLDFYATHSPSAVFHSSRRMGCSSSASPTISHATSATILRPSAGIAGAVVPPYESEAPLYHTDAPMDFLHSPMAGPQDASASLVFPSPMHSQSLGHLPTKPLTSALSPIAGVEAGGSITIATYTPSGGCGSSVIPAPMAAAAGPSVKDLMFQQPNQTMYSQSVGGAPPSQMAHPGLLLPPAGCMYAHSSADRESLPPVSESYYWESIPQTAASSDHESYDHLMLGGSVAGSAAPMYTPACSAGCSSCYRCRKIIPAAPMRSDPLPCCEAHSGYAGGPTIAAPSMGPPRHHSMNLTDRSMRMHRFIDGRMDTTTCSMTDSPMAGTLQQSFGSKYGAVRESPVMGHRSRIFEHHTQLAGSIAGSPLAPLERAAVIRSRPSHPSGTAGSGSGISHNPLRLGASVDRAHSTGTMLSKSKQFVLNSRALTRSGITLSELCDRKLITRLAMDQHGSRYIQMCLEHASMEEREMVFNQVSKTATCLALCEDVFGNYVIQKLFEHGNDRMASLLADKLIGRVLALTKSMYGCRVVQKALECVDIDTRVNLVQELEGHVEECVRDQNGNHVIQKAIEEVPSTRLQFVLDTFIGCVANFSTHPYGCRVIQRLLERTLMKQKKVLLEEILKEAIFLSRDQYGNYVVQHVIEFGDDVSRRTVINICCQLMSSMSKHKFGSNVVEKAFDQSTEKERDALLDAVLLCCDLEGRDAPIVQMVRDQYGNYVIQKLLEVCTATQRERVIKRMLEVVPNLRRLMFGKHIIAKIERLTGRHIP